MAVLSDFDAAFLLAAAGLSVVGFLNSLYFVLVTYRRIQPNPRWLPPFCRMDKQTCARVVDTKYARILGVPNAVWGLAWYLIAFLGALAEVYGHAFPSCTPLLIGASVAFAYSLWLSYALVARLKTICPLCILGHTINLLLLALVVLACAT